MKQRYIKVNHELIPVTEEVYVNALTISTNFAYSASAWSRRFSASVNPLQIFSSSCAPFPASAMIL